MTKEIQEKGQIEDDVFDSIPIIIYQAFTNLKLTEWAICQTKYENEDTIKGIVNLL